jgi:contractile injection system tube protein
VPEPAQLAKAQLQELDSRFQSQINTDRAVTVQFNPETLKVTFSNQVQQPQGGGDQRGPQAQQFVGAGTTKLALQLWFDVSALAGGQPNDVRRLTQKVAYYITPKANPSSQTQLIPPAVRFLWGTFKFDGIMDSLEESLEFFSPDGRPLRASLSLSLSQQQITEYGFGAAGAGGAGGGAGAASGGGGPAGGPSSPGTSPLAQATAGATLAGLAASAGVGGNWQGIAAANGIEDPLRLQAGALVDLSLKADVSVSAPTASLSVGIGA